MFKRVYEHLKCTACKMNSYLPSRRLGERCAHCEEGVLVMATEVGLLKRLGIEAEARPLHEAYIGLIVNPRGTPVFRHDTCDTLRREQRWIHECSCGKVLLDWSLHKEAE